MTVAATRLQSVMPRVIEALHELARELQLDNDELLAVLAFLAEVGREDELILLSDVLGLSRLVDDQTHAANGGTSSNVLGPFYRPGAPWIGNPGSIIAADASGTKPRSGWEPLRVSGRVTDARTGGAIGDAVLDVWQANEQGVYSNENAELDPWDLRGRQLTDEDGGYAFETVRPLHYTVKDDGPVGGLLSALDRHPWRPAHIHYKASADGYVPLVTQAYLGGGPYLADDTVNGVKDELVVPVERGAIHFDIALVPRKRTNADP
jgi:protocatechuate 3,4-dioxygenase beta subunit